MYEACSGRATYTCPHRLRKRRHLGATHDATLQAVKFTRENTDWYRTVHTTDDPYWWQAPKSEAMSANCIRSRNLATETPESKMDERSMLVC